MSCGCCQWFSVSVEWFDIIPVSKGDMLLLYDDGQSQDPSTIARVKVSMDDFYIDPEKQAHIQPFIFCTAK